MLGRKTPGPEVTGSNSTWAEILRTPLIHPLCMIAGNKNAQEAVLGRDESKYNNLKIDVKW